MRTTLITCTLAMLFACSPAPDALAPSTAESVRRFRFTYDVTFQAPPAGVTTFEAWLPVASNDPGVQTVSDLQIDASVPRTLEVEPTFGNRMLHVKVANPHAPIHVAWSAIIERHVDEGQGTLPPSERFLQATRRVPLDGRARALATSLGLDDEQMPLHERARRLYDDVLNGMDYDKSVPGYGQGDFERSVTVCKGNCTDFHSRFLGVGRAAGIPVRFSMGVPLTAASHGTYASYHCWAHYHDGEHWHPVDISEADKLVRTSPERADTFFRHLDVNRVTLSLGRDVDLAPKQQEPSLNYFVFPYVEQDGKAVTFEEPCWTFRWGDVAGS